MFRIFSKSGYVIFRNCAQGIDTNGITSRMDGIVAVS